MEKNALRKENINTRLIYVSLFVIIFLAVINHYTNEQMTSLVSIYAVIIIALGNIGYIYSRAHKKNKGSSLS